MADKIAVLRDGRLEQFGRPLDLYNAPANQFVAGFIGSPKMNFFPGKVDRGAVRLATGDVVPLPAGRFETDEGKEVTLGIRPNGLTPAASGLMLKVASVERLGGESYLYGTAPDGTAVTVHSAGQTGVEPGTDIPLALDAGGVHLFSAKSGRSLRKDTLS